MTPVQKFIQEIIASIHPGAKFDDRDQQRFAFYDRLTYESRLFEEWLSEQIPFFSFEKYADEPVIYKDSDTEVEWHKWLAHKGISMSDEFQ